MGTRNRIAAAHSDTVVTVTAGIAEMLRERAEYVEAQDERLGPIVAAVYRDAADRAQTYGMEVAEAVSEALR